MSTNAKRKRVPDEEQPNYSNTPSKQARRRQTNAAISSGSVDVVDLTCDEPATSSSTSNPIAKRPAKTPKTQTPKTQTSTPVVAAPEKRARAYRSYPTKAFLDRKHRATTQRMFVVGSSATEVDGVPIMTFHVVGSTGNIYKTVIGKIPYCTCPDNEKGNQCKHICYVLVNALKAPGDLEYQQAFLSTELREIYEGSSLSTKPESEEEEEEEEDTNGNRKPIEGECPICFMEFEPDNEDIVWCQARCGNNIHKACFQQWAASRRAQGVTCVYCRSPWEYEEKGANLDVQSLMNKGFINEEGYVNVADEVGLSGIRDHSTYSSWLGRRGRRGRNSWYYDDYEDYDDYYDDYY